MFEEEATTDENVPALQNAHAAELDAKMADDHVPVLQVWHELATEAPTTEEYLAAVHPMQAALLVAATLLDHVPRLQVLQDVTPNERMADDQLPV